MQILKFKGKLTSYDFQVDKIPDTCPVCEKGIQPEHHGGYVQIPEYDRMKEAQAVFRCPRDKCGYLFFGFYVQKFRNRIGDGILFLDGTHLVFHFEDRKFSETINTLSPEFLKIYNQALMAENNGLLEICGGGYRRALEFLIKDYLISREPDEKEKIENTFLGTLIEQKTSDGMKIVAERAAWLGNDESHYKRTWEDKDLENLKDLIDLTVYWVDASYKTSKYKEDMQKPKKKNVILPKSEKQKPTNK